MQQIGWFLKIRKTQTNRHQNLVIRWCWRSRAERVLNPMSGMVERIRRAELICYRITEKHPFSTIYCNVDISFIRRKILNWMQVTYFVRLAKRFNTMHLCKSIFFCLKARLSVFLPVFLPLCVCVGGWRWGWGRGRGVRVCVCILYVYLHTYDTDTLYVCRNKRIAYAKTL